MTDSEKLEGLLGLVHKLNLYTGDGHKDIGDGIIFYINNIKEFEDPKNAYFSFKYNKVEVRHCRTNDLLLEAGVSSFSDIDLNGWFREVEEKLRASAEVITLNGKKYRQIKE